MVMKIQKDSQSGQYLFGETLTGAMTGEPVSLPNDINVATIGLIIATGEGKIQVTLDSNIDIDAGNAAWLDWNVGSVTATTVDYIVAPVTAIRAVSTSGTVKFRVVG